MSSKRISANLRSLYQNYIVVSSSSLPSRLSHKFLRCISSRLYNMYLYVFSVCMLCDFPAFQREENVSLSIYVLNSRIVLIVEKRKCQIRRWEGYKESCKK